MALAKAEAWPAGSPARLGPAFGAPVLEVVNELLVGLLWRLHIQPG
jgi:hypothetical protein